MGEKTSFRDFLKGAGRCGEGHDTPIHTGPQKTSRKHGEMAGF